MGQKGLRYVICKCQWVVAFLRASHYPPELSVLFPHILHFSAPLSLSWRIYCTLCHAVLNTDIWRCVTHVLIYSYGHAVRLHGAVISSTDVFVRVRYVSSHIYSCCDATGCGKDTEHLANVVRSVSGEVCLYCLFQSMNTLRFPRWWSPLGTSRQINSAKSSKRENQMNTLDKNPGPN